MIVPFFTVDGVLQLSCAEVDKRIRKSEMLLTLMEFNAKAALPKFGYLDSLEALLVDQHQARVQKMIGSTYFGMWLETLGRWFQSASRSDVVLPPPLDLGFLERLSCRRFIREEDVPPFMRLLIPPSHSFRRDYIPDRTPDINEHSWEKALEVAIANADRMMPGMGKLIEGFVSHFLILEDVDFRSCSADRYLGVILLSTSDQSLIDIEESVVHEVGHQILYQLDRDCRLFITHDDDREVVLPWSGSQRNYFGFFHAAYIYLILRDYYTVAAQEHPFDRAYCKERLEAIQTGLDKAVPLLVAGLELLEPAGEQLMSAMISHIEEPHVPPRAELATSAAQSAKQGVTIQGATT